MKRGAAGQNSDRRSVLFRFERASDVVVVHAKDVGYAVEIWVQWAIGTGWETREMSRFHDPDELEQRVQVIKASYLAEGWRLTEV